MYSDRLRFNGTLALVLVTSRVWFTWMCVQVRSFL